MSGQHIELEWEQLPASISGLLTGFSHQVILGPRAVPLIFVPGIMGSRLKRGEERAWDPDAPLWMARNYMVFWTSPAERKEKLVGSRFDADYLEPLLDDEEHNADCFGDVAGADARRWGGVAWGFYGEILKALHKLNESGDCQGYCLPVYAFPYNWSGPNAISGRKLSDYIREVKAEVGQEYPCEKVILITHSMGGIVARVACMLEGAESDVLAVLHGVQPVTGSPAAYWRMKAGFERVGLFGFLSSWVLGSSGAHVTALLGNMPGGLELLPTQEYRYVQPERQSSPMNAGEGVGRASLALDGESSRRWLRFVDSDGHDLPELARPVTGNPYDEIYKERAQFWRLVIPEYLDPDAEASGSEAASAVWSEYESRVDTVGGFHARLALQRHKDSTAFYGSGFGHPCADIVQWELETVGWSDEALKGLKRMGAAGLGAMLARFLNPWLGVGLVAWDWVRNTTWWKSHGGCEVEVTLPDGSRLRAKLLDPSGPGDGTVPESSGVGLELPATPFAGLEHSAAYQLGDPPLKPPPNTIAAQVFDFVREKVAGQGGAGETTAPTHTTGAGS